MSMDRSLKAASALTRHRNVLTRAERIKQLAEEERWSEEQSVLGLPKVAHRSVKVGKKAKEEKKETATTEEVEKKEGESTKERNAREVATRLGVDPKILGRLAQLTDGSIGEIEKEAKGLPKVAEAKDPLKADSGKTMGGGEKTDEQKLKDRYPTM